MTWFWLGTGAITPPVIACCWGILDGLIPLLNKLRPPEWRGRSLFFADWLFTACAGLILLQTGIPVASTLRGWPFRAGLAVSLIIGVALWWWNRRQRRRHPDGSGVGYKIAAVYERLRAGWRSPQPQRSTG
jgi:hypothetical protein